MSQLFIGLYHDRRELTCDITRHTPRIARLIAPSVDVRLAPVTQRIQDSATLLQKSISHPRVPGEGIRLGPVVPSRRWIRKARTSTIRRFAGTVRDTCGVLVCPVTWDAAVVILQVYEWISRVLQYLRGRKTPTVNSPLRESACINLLIPQASRVPRAGSLSSTFKDVRTRIMNL